MEYVYLTLVSPVQGVYKEKGSKFLAFGYPVSDEASIKQHLAGLKKEYHDARHHCFAWVLGPDRKRSRAMDDGEPNHSAGDPILGQLRKHNLTDVLMVVVRYFGGTKLGVGGLTAAYRAAAKDALSTAEIVERYVQEDWVMKFGYESAPEVMKLVKAFHLEVLDQDFHSDCRLTVRIRLKDKESLLGKVKLLRGLGISLEIMKTP